MLIIIVAVVAVVKAVAAVIIVIYRIQISSTQASPVNHVIDAEI